MNKAICIANHFQNISKSDCLWIFNLKFSILSYISLPSFHEWPFKAWLWLSSTYLKCYSFLLFTEEIVSSMRLLKITQTFSLMVFNNGSKFNHRQRLWILITIMVDIRMWPCLIWKYNSRMISFNGNSPKPVFFTPAEFCLQLHILYSVCITVLRACHFLSEWERLKR